MARQIAFVETQTGEITVRDMTPEEEAQFSTSPEELEEQVQALADRIVQNDERDRSIALATIDLAIAVRDGQVASLSKAELRQLFRDRVVEYLRESRGL